MEISVPISELRKKRIFVATPMYGGQCSGMYTKASCDLATTATKYQIDVKFSVEEETTGNIGGNLGYSDFGLMLGFNLQERNFLGTGNSVGININKSIYQEAYNLS